MKHLVIRLYLNRVMFHFFALGIASGIPFFLVLSTLSFWLTESGIGLSAIGLFTWVTIPYSLKFLWSPFLDRLITYFPNAPFKGYKIWGMASQIGVIGSTCVLGSLSPHTHLFEMALMGIILSFCAASLDIMIDTVRIELCSHKTTGVAAAIESTGFRMGMLIGGAGALYLASLLDWNDAYWIMGGVQVFALPVIYFLPTCAQKNNPTSSHAHVPVLNKEKSFTQHLHKSLHSLRLNTPFVWLLALVFIFKIPDTLLNSMSAPFLYHIGFNKIEYANVTKMFGIPLMVMGSLIAGHLVHQFGARLVVAIMVFMQATSCLLFVLQHHIGHDLTALMITVGIESFSSGLTSTAFIALVSLYCSSPFSASHFTFLNAISSLSRIIFSAFAGIFADLFGWKALFFIGAIITGFTFACLLQIRKHAHCHDPLKK